MTIHSKTAIGILAGAEEFDSYEVGIVTSDEVFRCVECDGEILPGQSHEFFEGVRNSKQFSYRTCRACLDMAGDYMEARVYGMLRYVVWAEAGVDIVTGAIASEESVPPFEDDPACAWRLDW